MHAAVKSFLNISSLPLPTPNTPPEKLSSINSHKLKNSAIVQSRRINQGLEDLVLGRSPGHGACEPECVDHRTGPLERCRGRDEGGKVTVVHEVDKVSTGGEAWALVA